MDMGGFPRTYAKETPRQVNAARDTASTATSTRGLAALLPRIEWAMTTTEARRYVSTDGVLPPSVEPLLITGM